MKKVASSPERHTFQRDSYIKRCQEEGKQPDQSIVEMYNTWAKDDRYENRPEHDLEYDLRTTEWILEKARTSDAYAQNLYAAMCNMQWQKRELWPELSEQRWSCSWRSSGGIIADMLEKGDYIDWYCSGMGGLSGYDQDSETFEEWQARTKYVSEGVVTEEIELDLNRLGWRPVPWNDE